MARTLTIRIFRYDPREKESRPVYQEFQVTEKDGMTVYQTMDEVQTQQDPSLYFDVVCRSNVCGSCAININGQPRLACKTQTKTLPETIVLEPLWYFALIKDLSTDKGAWFMNLTKRFEGWIHPKEPFDPEKEHPMSDQEALPVYEADRCIECGICVESCGAAKWDPDYLGAAGLNKMFRFAVDKRDHRGVPGLMAVLESDEGVFGCEAMLGCREFCPKEIALPGHIAKLRNRVVIQTVKNTFAALLGRGNRTP